MEKRTKNAVVTLIVGLILNISLGATKLVVGLLSGSTSVTSDSVNNLSDAAVSVVTIIAAALAARHADHDHPFGHGRYEYIAAFVLGAVIGAVGIEVFIGGVKRAVSPVDVVYDVAVWVALGVSVAVKFFMFVFYTVRGKVTGSETIKAAAIDSISDVCVTGVVLICAIVERFTNLHIDGYASIAVAIVIIILAFRILKRTVSRLLGERPSKDLEKSVTDILMSAPHIVSVHDLIINDYGESYKIAEVDAVFPSPLSFVEVHAVCDMLEREVLNKTGVRICIHADPDFSDDERLVEISKRISELLSGYGATAHDFSIDDENKRVELDIRLPDDKAPKGEILAQTESAIKAVVPYTVDIEVDYA